MAQYIQHPALMGAQMAGDLTKQRMNLVGQGVTQAVDALNRQAAADAAATTKMMEYQALMNAQRNPLTGVVEEKPVTPKSDWMDKFNQMMLERQARRGGYNLTQQPGTPSWYTGAPILTPAAEVAPLSAVYPSEYKPTTLNFPDIQAAQSAYPVPTKRSIVRDILNLDIFGVQNP